MSARRSAAAAALIVGVGLGILDAGLYHVWDEAASSPIAFLSGLATLCAIYVLLALPPALVLRWHALLGVSAVVTGTIHFLARYYSRHPDFQIGGAVASLALGAALGGLAALILVRLVPRAPRASKPIAWVASVLAVLTFAGIGYRTTLGQETAKKAATVETDAASASDSAGADNKPNLLVFTFDTLRADRVGANGYDGIATPGMDRLAAEGVLFADTVAQAPMTPPSHASIFTGLYPAGHGIRAFEGNNSLRSDVPTLAEIVSAAGYRTGAIIASSPLTPGMGIERGFDDYIFSLPPVRYPFVGLRKTLLANTLKRTQLVRDSDAYWNAEVQTRRALAWLAENDDRPFFLWVHYFDAHDPYAPPRRYLSPSRHPDASVMNILDRSYLYDSDVAYLDSEVRRLIDHLRKGESLDRTLVIGISDHGEGLGEHDYVGHSERLYEEQLRIPFFMRYPKRLPADRTVSTQVRTVDVLPTVLDILGLRTPQDLDGRSLLPLIDRPGTGKDRIAISETLQNSAKSLISVNDGRYKLIVDISSKTELLFDLRSDPGETKNIIGDPPPEAVSLRQIAATYTERSNVDEGTSNKLDPAIRQRLRALGYLE